MSRVNQRSNLFQSLWNTLWNGLTSTNTKRGTHTPGATRQTGVPENTKPQVRPFRSTHPLKGEAPNGTAASPGADDWRTYDHLDVILTGPTHFHGQLLICPSCTTQIGTDRGGSLIHNEDGSHTWTPDAQLEHSDDRPRVKDPSSYVRGDLAWVEVRQGWPLRLMRKTRDVGPWQAIDDGAHFYAGDIWDIAGPAVVLAFSAVS